MPLRRKQMVSVKLYLAFGAAVLALLVSCVISNQALVVSKDSQRWLRHSHEVLDNLEASLLAMKSIESSYQRFALTGEEFRLDSYRTNSFLLKLHLATVRRLMTENPLQQNQMPALERLTAQEIQLAETVIAVRRAKGSEAAADALRTAEGERPSDRFAESVNGLQDEERRLLVIRTVDVKRRLKNSELTTIMVTALGFLIVATAFWSVRREAASRGFAERALLDSETRYRGLLEAAPDAMVVVNQVGKIVLLNVQAEKQFGYRRDELLGQEVENIIPEGFAERIIADGTRTTTEALEQQIGTGIELSGRRKDGSRFPLEIMLSPLESAEGILVTAAIRNISVRKDAEKHLVRVEAEYSVERERSRDAREEKERLQMTALEQSRQDKVRLQERFLSHVSHELRTPSRRSISSRQTSWTDCLAS
jgi:PAS domain S-box-containing protein